MAKMKRSEKILWLMVAVALSANIWLPRHLKQRYSWERDLSQRCAVDFCKTRDEVKKEIREFYPYVSDTEIDSWTESGKLESMVIGKRTMYFRDAASNLRLLDSKFSAGVAIPLGPYSAAAKRGWTRPGGDGTPAVNESVRLRVKFSLTVPVHTLRPGKTLRCWLPYPRADYPGQTGIRLIEAGVDSTAYSSDKITFSEPSCAHSSLYMEAKTNRYSDVTFYEIFEVTCDPTAEALEAAEESTEERDKHLVFTDRIKSLADSLTAGCDTPEESVEALRSWTDKNIVLACSRENSTIDNIPEYVLSSGHGNYGQKTLLLMTLLRSKGIPAGWISGPTVTPEGSAPFILVVNNDFGRELSPAKQYPRSDDVDFCRGEVEWEGGNLYFNQWNYDFQIEYL
ncbi:MAG: transglutaminase domain-containing protein [Bacteroidales bacterium]|nr:transglutaminase domain-containing protein [Bacteroidales bacterium]